MVVCGCVMTVWLMVVCSWCCVMMVWLVVVFQCGVWLVLCYDGGVSM